ncbi:MAG: 2-oxoacid:acceptor oxidoreductase family protein [Clostridium sp.]|uniref:2-oxoacid:acceptor oxidoreductase family protein n=1 Tax=Clostridium sp. TaxID=1506 RepID=UPI001ECFF3FE|nr:2-oxoacid:acceptor oxidoreductase family protein [Clostridium sp.]MBS5885697.1 2-oxoacid:acceptor oxidoreductase family protein [Clostridium sp.]MDU7149627.1 2-oxoacid:acceptor oxidoreductase family protein [Clostridium sp.]MDU7242393.1 2-oxoacid:acceptor oxidoreductase family protein [Clostridium sp.]
MIKKEIIFAGFGGQGILTAGKFLAYAAMDKGFNVSWLPSYGPEMRGGTANCSVIISDEEVGSPVISEADIVVVMNKPSLDKFSKSMRDNGTLIIDSDMVKDETDFGDIEVYKINAESKAEKLGDKRNANMILLGFLIEKLKIISIDDILNSIRFHGKKEYYELNKAAIELGAKIHF